MKLSALCLWSTLALAITAPIVGCSTQPAVDDPPKPAPAVPAVTLVPGLPIVGVLVYPGVLGTEVSAPIDVFAKHSEAGDQLFNVITIAQTTDLIRTEEGLRIAPDATFADAPDLQVLVVPSAYDMSSLVKNEQLVQFIREQNQHTQYTVSNCAGAHLIGEAGIASGKKIVTWIGGGEELREKYPDLDVQDDGVLTYVEDGKFLSSNGNLASYVSALELLEKMTNKPHRQYIEGYLYLERLRSWK